MIGQCSLKNNQFANSSANSKGWCNTQFRLENPEMTFGSILALRELNQTLSLVFISGFGVTHQSELV